MDQGQGRTTITKKVPSDRLEKLMEIANARAEGRRIVGAAANGRGTVSDPTPTPETATEIPEERDPDPQVRNDGPRNRAQRRAAQNPKKRAGYTRKPKSKRKNRR